MQRVKGLGQTAFAEFDAAGMHQRIIWRFLDGVRDKDVRSEIIRARWMKDRKTPKPFDEVLKIAEGAKMLKVAASATGHGGQNSVAPIQSRYSSNNPSTSKSKTAGPECYYCNERHAGGWRSCKKRKRENPAWTPRDRKGSHESGASSSQRSSSPPFQ